MIKQSENLTMTCFITAHDQLGPISKYICDVFGFDKVLFMNSGYEAVDSAIQMARKWGYREKKVPKGKAKIIFPKNCYWGNMIAARTGCFEKERKENFEPLNSEDFMFDFIDFDNT
jgi:ornithine--oxo-acid transaminase